MPDPDDVDETDLEGGDLDDEAATPDAETRLDQLVDEEERESFPASDPHPMRPGAD